MLSPDASKIAYLAQPLGSDRGTLYVMDSITGTLSNSLALAEDVSGQLAWYDPAP